MSHDKENPKGVLSHTEAIFREILKQNDSFFKELDPLYFYTDKDYQFLIKEIVGKIKSNEKKVLQMLGE